MKTASQTQRGLTSDWLPDFGKVLALSSFGNLEKIDIHGTKLRPEGFRVFKNDVLSLWDKAVYRFPWQPPLQINSEHLELFEFIERTSPDENSWLMFSTQQLGQYVSGMICRGNTSASNRSYYKAEPLFLEELNSLVKENKLLLWYDNVRH